MTPEKPYEWGHPQFDRENHAEWTGWVQKAGYGESGLVFLRQSRPGFDFRGRPLSR